MKIETFNEYQLRARLTALYPDMNNNIIYPTLGLVGESGEIAEKVKKLIRDNDGIMTDEWKLSVKKELGDVLWYISNMCNELGFKLEDVALLNIEKLNKRMEENKIKGDGDDR